MTRFLSIALLALLLAALAAGCGSSSDGSEPTLSKAEYLRQADAICSKIEKVRGNEYQAFILKIKPGPENPISDENQEVLIKDIILPAIQSQAEGVRELGPPVGSEEKAEKIVSGVEDVVGELEDEPMRYTTNEYPFEKVAKEAAKFNFQQCFRYL